MGSSTTTTPKVPACVHPQTLEALNSYFGTPDPKGTSLDYVASQLSTHDGNGNPIRTVGQSVEIARRDGTVTLSDGGNAVVFRGFGDFDGGGRSDVVVDDFVGGTEVSYIVPGTAAPGIHNPSDVGIRLPAPHLEEGDFLGWWTPAGDQNRDGADDLVLNEDVYSGRQLTAAGPGRGLAVMPAPLRTLPRPYLGILQLDADAPPTFVGADQDASELEVLDRHSDRLAFHGSLVTLTTVVRSGAHVAGWRVNGHRIVQLESSGRSGGNTWRWDLDGSCSKVAS